MELVATTGKRRTCDDADVADLVVIEVVAEERRLELLLLDDAVAVVYFDLEGRPAQVLAQCRRVHQACKQPHVSSRTSATARQQPHVSSRTSAADRQRPHVSSRTSAADRQRPHVSNRTSAAARQQPHVSGRTSATARQQPHVNSRTSTVARQHGLISHKLLRRLVILRIYAMFMI